MRQWFKNLSKVHKILTVSICAFIFFDIILLAALFSANKTSSIKLEYYGNTNQVSSLKALNAAGKKACIKGDDYAYFKFSEAQKQSIKNLYEELGNVALSVRVTVIPTTKQSLLLDGTGELPFHFGFLDNDDFNSKGKFKKQVYPNTKRIVVKCDQQFAPETMDISLSLQKSEAIEKYIPEGFFIHSSLRCYIKAAAFVPAYIGFDKSDSIPFYGFPYNGGVISFDNKGFDFTGAALVFPVQNKINSRMAEYVITFNDNKEFKSTLDKSVYADISFGGEKLRVKNVTQGKQIIIPAASLKAPYSRVEITSNAECIDSITLRKSVSYSEPLKNAVLYPIKTDPGLILKYKQENWRTKDYELYAWDRYERILFFDTKDYEIQDKFFTRMAFFVEKQGFNGRLMSDEELEGLHGYNAHDYKPDDMARFFNTAVDIDFKLNPYELLLKQILIANKLFESDGIYVKPAPEGGGIVSISRQTPDWSRINLFAHEGWHMQFFADEEFRNYVSAVYYTCDSNTRDFLIDYFKSQPTLGYDVNNEYLMHNEFMAYVMEKPVSVVASDFVKKANWASVNKFTPELCEYIRRTKGQGFEDISIALNDFVFDKYGIIAGNIGLVNR